MLISVKILKGGECDIEVSATASITSVKEIVAQQLRIPVDQQRLVFKGKTLLDSETLCDYNIVEGNKLHLFVREDAPSTPQQAPPDFFEQLQKFLEKHFTPSDAEKVLEEFRKMPPNTVLPKLIVFRLIDFADTENLSDQLRHLSLDDIERIATFHLDSDNEHNSPVAAENTPMQI